MKKTLDFIWTYLKDWKNILAHTFMGLLILAIGFYLPVKPVYRIILMVLIIVLNTIRMKRSESKSSANEEEN
ncbi:MAG: hypothetical protein ISR58_02820 [Anaerolineales bacterium]|nr:hypothetical protein [Chloroflexota bacterium]MBL6980103.1 hypothetical protein [Anaerolineales bacterium]